MNDTERLIYVFDAEVRSRAKHAPPASMRALAAVFEHQFCSDNCCHVLGNGSLIYRLGDIKIDDERGILTLLIRRADENAPNATYSHMQTGRLRVAKKEEGEGGDTAAHLIISLTQTRDAPGRYLCMLEGMPGLSAQPVQLLLNRLIRTACKEQPFMFNFPHPGGAKHRDGSPKLNSYVPHIEMKGHISDSLLRDIEQGTVGSIELTRSRPGVQLGGDPYLVEDRYSLKIKVLPDIPVINRLPRILKTMFSNKGEFKVGKVNFSDPSGKQRHIEYDLDEEKPIKDDYVKCFAIQDIKPPLDQSTEVIADQLALRMAEEVINQRNI